MPFSRNAFSGFPFDNSRRGRDPLEDIAQRHPEFAQHLQGFPRRAARPEQGDNDFLRRFERPFSSGRFGFPFDREEFQREPQRFYDAHPEYFENSQSPNQFQETASQPTQQHFTPPPSHTQRNTNQDCQESQPQQHTLVTQGTQTETDSTEPVETEKQVQKDTGHTRGRPIQQSNTVDLGQKQPLDEAAYDRNQRSMSAPPENKRFTSSVHVPMGGHQGHEDATKGQSQGVSSGSTERVIPIHVEGRDDPIIPRRFASSTGQPQPEVIFGGSPRPQPERIFSPRADPEQFGHHRGGIHSRFPSDWAQSPFDSFPDEDFGFRRSESPSRFANAKPHQQQFRQENVPQAAEQHEPPKTAEAPQAPPKQQPPKQPAGPIEQIQVIQKDVSSLLNQVEAFKGMPKDKNYLYLDEMLTRNLLKLDNIDTQGQDAIRSARKEAIKCIERAISLLESKAAQNAAPNLEKMDVDQQSSQGDEKMDTNQSAQTENNSQELNNVQSQNVNQSIDSSETTEVVNKSQDITKEPGLKPTTNEPSNIQETMDVEGNSKVKPDTQSVEGEKNNTESGKPDCGSEKQENSVNDQTVQDDKTTEVKDETKKEKKKIKKKVNKEDKEKKQ
ncbi:BAG domain-containing protein Samui isoform X2 [Sitophilus oryzae]|uniref:BAG domain-containing protein Samui isoform X2 n=1 Tax=Sitophilus oryzae TaxID=7048 RepID=A0A6J2X506_SITOR|nr:BAG domain-containing protein Samui isoform X2 [Sitophilus oryzae]